MTTIPPSDVLKPLSKMALYLARRLPLGYWQVLKFAAARDPALHNYPLAISNIPGAVINADLRETVYTGLLRRGCIPHQRAQDALYLEILEKGDVVIDVGANIGYLAMLFAYAVGPTGHVVAIEPGRRILPLLKRNTSQFKNIDVRDICASDQDGLVTFHESEMSDTSSMLSIANAVSYTVSATTLDKLVAGLRTQPSLVKIDVEGCEDRVLQGAANILARDNPPIVVFEALTFEARERCVKVFGQVVGNRYAIYRIQPDANLLPCESEHGTNDYLAVPDWAADRVRRAIPLAAEKMVQR